MALKDNKLYRLIIIPICVALCFIGKFIPSFGGLSTEAIQVLFIFLGCLILWLTIGIDWPSLLCIFALGFVDSLGFSKVLSSSFGNATFIFLLFTFICTYALSKTSIIKRITLWFINTPLARKNGIWFSFLFLFSVLIVGLFTSPSVLFVVVLPILNEVFNIANIKKGDKIAKAFKFDMSEEELKSVFAEMKKQSLEDPILHAMMKAREAELKYKSQQELDLNKSEQTTEADSTKV